MNIECRMSKEGVPSILYREIDAKIKLTLLFLKLKKSERSDSTLRNSLFVIRYSAVRFSLQYLVPILRNICFSGQSKLNSTHSIISGTLRTITQCPLLFASCIMPLIFCLKPDNFRKDHYTVVCY